MEKYGNIRTVDVPTLEAAVGILKKHGFRSGIHGTSLWNKNYKDLDLLAITARGNIKNSDRALNAIVKKLGGKVLGIKGNPASGLDYDIKVGKLMLHLSFVVLLS